MAVSPSQVWPPIYHLQDRLCEVAHPAVFLPLALGRPTPTQGGPALIAAGRNLPARGRYPTYRAAPGWSARAYHRGAGRRTFGVCRETGMA